MIKLHGPPPKFSQQKEEESNNNELVTTEKSPAKACCIPRKISVKSMDKIDVEKRVAEAESKNRNRA